MIGEKIKYYRNKNHLSQKELAIQLNVVRQTVSKWENNLSVPDEDILVQIARVLNISVNELLDIKDNNLDLENELAKRLYIESLNSQVEQKRNLILFLSFIALIVSMIFKEKIITMITVTICLLLIIGILYRNLVLLSSSTKNPTYAQTKALRLTTLFTTCVLLVSILTSCFVESKSINENKGDMIVVLIISAVIIFGGGISLKLPFTRHTGLRLTWTVYDEDTWNVAHKIMAYISLPIVFVYFLLFFTTRDVKLSTMISFLSWILIPSLLSLLFYMKKVKGKL